MGVLKLFPLGKTGGLIEASSARPVVGARSGAFPLGKTGGLIEAGRMVPARRRYFTYVSAG